MLDVSLEALRYTTIFLMTLLFLYWAEQAWEKYQDEPIASSVEFRNGDDDKSNFIFPAVTVCLGSLKMYVTSQGQESNELQRVCSKRRPGSLLKMLDECVNKIDSSRTTTETATYGGFFGGLLETTTVEQP